MNHEMHVIGTDVLLWALGGLGQPADVLDYHSHSLPLSYVSELKALARNKRNLFDVVRAVANRYGRSAQSAVQLIYIQRRRPERVARYWAEAA